MPVLCHFLYVRGSFFVHFCGVVEEVCVGIDVVVVDGGAFSWRSLNVQHSKIYQLCSLTWKHGSHVHIACLPEAPLTEALLPETLPIATPYSL